jgi:hypothetical protein
MNELEQAQEVAKRNAEADEKQALSQHSAELRRTLSRPRAPVSIVGGRGWYKVGSSPVVYLY